MNEQLFIPTIADLERILDEHPEIRESLRRKLLTDDERQLPKVVERLADNLAQLTRTVADGFAAAAADRAAIRKEVADGFAEASADRAAIKAGQQRLESQFNQFREEMYEARVQPKTVSWTIISMGFTNPVISRPVNAGNTPEFNSIIQQALSSNRITREEAMDLCNADLIISGDDNQHIIAEISITADDSNLERAVRRAGIMQQAANGSCTPAIIAQNIPEPLSSAASDQGAATVIFT